ncbi:MAG: VCBS repeat-containing protein [Myxococcota bacterium]
MGGWSQEGFVRLSGQAYDPGDEDWTTVDLSGDGVLDLVVTAVYQDGAFAVLGHGSAPHWKVHLGTESGFTTNATTWPVPAGGWNGQGFVRLSGMTSDPGDEDWTTVDLNGDGLLDLVVTARYADGEFAVLGQGISPHWKVYLGTGTGFATGATTWPVPAGGWSQEGFVRLAGQAYDPGDEDWTTVDLNGDGVLDLVVTAVYQDGAFAVLGHGSAPHWKVYLGTESGFTTTATTWPVPAGGWNGQGFVRPSGMTSDPGDEDWTTVDLNGDGLLDLVVTARFADGEFAVLGQGISPHWKVYLGTGTGFAAGATTWPVPAGGWSQEGFVRLAGQAYDPGDEDWTTVDLNRDGVLDLVVTAVYQDGAFAVLGHGSAPHWKVHLGTESGFATTATTWPVPAGGWNGQGFVRLSGMTSDPGDEDWTTVDLNGDGLLDLVVTALYADGEFAVLGGPGAPHWEVYFGVR